MQHHFRNNTGQLLRLKTAGIAVLLLLTGSAAFGQKKKAATTSPKATFQAEYIYPFQTQHVHSSSVVELPNGDLLCCWFQGSGERSANDVAIKGARLKKGETRWSEPFVLADTPDNPDCNPVLFLDNSNRLHLTWIVVMANQWESSLLKTRISTDYLGAGAPKWNWQDVILLKPGEEFARSIPEQFKKLPTPELAWGGYAPKYEAQIAAAAKDPVKRETGWMGRIKPTILPGGRILLPLYSDGYNLSLVAISDDNAETWKPSLPIVGRGNIQPAILRKKDGSLVAYMRDNGDAPGRIQKSISTDNGYTWTPCEKTTLPNPGASVDALALNDGRWVMIYNDLEEGRYRLAVSLSEDEGATWKYTRYLENNREGGFSYPSIIQSRDGKIHATYSYHVKNEKTIKQVSFAADWIMEQPAATTNAEKLGFPKGKKVILLHMDDLGMCDEANQSGEFYMQNGFVNSGAVMMPCPYAKPFIDWAKKNPKADVGVHLTLTSEWKTYRWPSVTSPAQVPGLIDPEGKLWRDVPEVVAHATAAEVETEIRAQIDQMIALGHRPTHMDTHMGTLYGSPEYVKVFLKVAEEYGIPANAIDLSDPKVANKFKAMGYPISEAMTALMDRYSLPKLDDFGSVPNGKTYAEKKENFIKLVNSLENGLTEIIFHPSVETENLKSITGSWQQRVWEAQMFSDPEIRKFLADQDIILTDWKDIMNRFNQQKR